jgi:hypothetical protein
MVDNLAKSQHACAGLLFYPSYVVPRRPVTDCDIESQVVKLPDSAAGAN